MGERKSFYLEDVANLFDCPFNLLNTLYTTTFSCWNFNEDTALRRVHSLNLKCKAVIFSNKLQ